MAIGVFDGMHIGHQAVLAAALDAARADAGITGLVTFDPHPIRVIAPAKAPRALLETVDHKRRLAASLGIDGVLALRFDPAMAALEPEEFVRRLAVPALRTIAVGEDWRFGRGRQGDADLLARLGARSGFNLRAVSPVMFEGERVSSTRIRQAIRDGNLDSAAAMLGRPYTVIGTVITGKHLGRTIGFPTANLTTGDAQLPPDGVWAVRARINDGPPLNAIANLGVRPTVDGINHILEVHFFDFSQEIYGAALEIEFLGLVRNEMKFPSLDALKAQIAEDIRTVHQDFFPNLQSK